MLLTLAGFEGEDNNLAQVKALAEQAMNIARQTENIRLYHQGINILGNLLFQQKRYEEALKHYFEALRALSDVQGDYFLAFDLHLKAGLCLSFMGDRFKALEFLAEAETIAGISGNEVFAREAQEAIAFVNHRFLGTMVGSDKPKVNPQS